MMSFLTWCWSIARGALNAFAVIGVMLAVVLVGLAAVGLASGDGLPRQIVLALDLRKPMEDRAPGNPFGFDEARTGVVDVVLGLDEATRDPRVKGVLLRVGTGGLGVAQAEELGDALKRFRKSGKFVIAHSQGFFHPGLGDYLMAASADEIWMQPASFFFPAGAAATTIFYKGLFEKLEAEPQFVKRSEYKNAANVYMEKDFTPEHREATTHVLQSWYQGATAAIAADRGMDGDVLKDFFENAPATVEEVKAKGLIDEIGYDDDAKDRAVARAGDDAEVVEFAKFAHAKREARQFEQGPKIAFVHAAGDIVDSPVDADPFGNDNIVAGDEYAEAIREATEDEDIKAILIRVDSPGGSPTASDQIRDAVAKAREAGKPIVVSMGSVAASGGYYLSLEADRIVAQPATLTGSIGVVWGKVAVGNTLNLVGLSARQIGEGKNALFVSGIEPWTPEQMADVNQQADYIYKDFTTKVAEGRKLPIEKVQDLARGRVWTGTDAKERGLVDALGGLWTALDATKELAGIDKETRAVLEVYPKPKGIFAVVARFFGTSIAGLQALSGLHVLMNAEPVRALIEAVRAAPDGRAMMHAPGLPRRQ